MNSSMFNWSSNDFVRSVTTAVFVAVVAALYGLTSQANFDLFTVDWSAVLKLIVNSAFITFMARMAEKFVTADNGKIFGRIG